MPRFQIQAYLQPQRPFFLLAGQGVSLNKTQPGAPSLQSNVGLVQPALALSRSSEVLELQATDHSAHLVNPYIRFLPKNLLFSHFLLAKVIKNQEKQPKKDKML